MTRRSPSILVLICLAFLGAGAITVTAPTSAYAAGTLGQKVGKPLQEAQQAAKAGDMGTALAKAKEAQAVTPKTPYEAFVVNEFLAYVYVKQKDYRNAIVAYEASLKSGQVPNSERPKRIKTLAQLSYQVKDCGRVLSYANQLGKDPDLQALVAQCYYSQRNYTQAMATSKAIIDAADAAGRAPSKSALAMYLSSAYVLKDNASVRRALFRLVELYPSDAYWNTLVKEVANQGGLGDYARLDLQRVQYKLNLLKTDDDWFNFAKLAFAFNLPGDAQTILNQGFQKKILGNAQGGRDQRLLAVVKDAAAKDLAKLPADETAANASTTPGDIILVGQRYASFGQYPKAITLINKALTKPGVTDADGVRLDLARIYFAAGKPDQARKTLQSIKTDGATKDVGRLMSIAN